MTTKIQKWGNSLAVRIPNEFAENLNLRDGSIVGFRQSGDEIVIARARPKYTLEQLLQSTNKKNIPKKLIFPDDKPRGKEVW